MAGATSLDSVRRKIQSLQQQADEAEGRAEGLQRELDTERQLREQVSESGDGGRAGGGTRGGRGAGASDTSKLTEQGGGRHRLPGVLVLIQREGMDRKRGSSP